MAAVVVCLHHTFWVVGIDVEGVQMCADRFDWSKVLEICNVRSNSIMLFKSL